MSTKAKYFNGRDTFARMNFMYQASVAMAGTETNLSAYYGRLCKSVARKAVLRIDPDIKRRLCKKCGVSLQPGITADLSMDEQQKNRFSVQCRKCNFRKDFVVNKKYSFWLEDPRSVADTLDCSKRALKKESEKNGSDVNKANKNK